MKKKRLGFIIFFLALIGLSVTAFSQVPAKTELNVKKVGAVLNIPDLVLQNFSVYQNAQQTSGVFEIIPFQVSVVNRGSGPVTRSFHVAFQYFQENLSSWQGEGDPNNCFTVNALLKPNHAYMLQGKLKVLRALLSDRNLRVRVIVDHCCQEEFPPKNGLIAEMNETNNASNEVTLSGSYLPYLAGVSPSVATKVHDEVTLAGNAFGSQAGNHTIVVQKGSAKIEATILSWHEGVIKFKIPAAAEKGDSKVYIGKKGSLESLSNQLALKVIQKNVLEWNQLIYGWNIFKDAFSIRLHTWSGDSAYSNKSEMAFFEKIPLDVPNIQFKKSVGYYRFLVNDLKSLESGITLTRTGCKANQMRLEVAFESAGKELMGYYKVLGPAGKWRSEGAPDIQVDNAHIGILFTLMPAGNSLNYSINTNFSANVNASGKTWDNILDAFMGNWDGMVKQKVNQGVHNGMLNSAVKQKIIDSLMNVIKLLSGIGNDKTITQIGFTNSHIEVWFY